jgi:hypothetical protein
MDVFTAFPQRRPDDRAPGLELGLDVGIHCVDVELLKVMHGVLG